MSDLKKDQQRQEEIQRVAKHITHILGDQPGIDAVYLLGSAATGTFRGDSDIDIALLPVDEQAISL